MSTLLSDYNSNSRISSNVARTKVYSDLDPNFSINPLTRDISPLSDIDAVKNSIKNLVRTNFHDRPFQPTIGSGLTALLFEPANTFTAIEIRNAIIKVITRYETRATDVDVSVIDNSDRNAYTITVTFRVFYDDSVNEFDFYLTRLR